MTPMFRESCLSVAFLSGQYALIRDEVAITAFVAVKGICANPTRRKARRSSSRGKPVAGKSMIEPKRTSAGRTQALT